MKFLLDTNVLSELRKGQKARPEVLSWFESVPDQSLFVSVLVLAEIRTGVERLRRRDPASAHAYDEWLNRLRSVYAKRILPVTLEIADTWGRLHAIRSLPVVDGLLAATAHVLDMTLVTRNVKDMPDIALLNPFDTLNSTS